MVKFDNDAIKKLTQVAEWLEAGAPHKKFDGGSLGFHMNGVFMHPDGLDMREWNQGCDTIMCIAGAVNQFSKEVPVDKWEKEEEAAKTLGVSLEEVFSLFYPPYGNEVEDGSGLPEDISYDDISPSDAAIVIRHLIATGEINWSLPYV